MDECVRNRQIAKWIINDLFAVLKEQKVTIEWSPITPRQLGRLVDLIREGTISGKTAKEVFKHMAEGGKILRNKIQRKIK